MVGPASGIHFGTAVNAVYIDRFSGDVGIGTTSPSFTLDVNGSVRCVGAVNTSSDARYKSDIAPVTDALGTVLRLRGVSFDWRRAEFPEKQFDDRRQIGFVAQEVREVLPEIVTADRDGFLSVGYSEVIPVLTSMVQVETAEGRRNCRPQGRNRHAQGRTRRRQSTERGSRKAPQPA